MVKEEPENEPAVQLPKPDFSQFIPFKPKANAYPGAHPLAGGVFPQPPALAALCATLPPPICFRGPFVSIEMLFDIFNRIKLTDGETLKFTFPFHFLMRLISSSALTLR